MESFTEQLSLFFGWLLNSTVQVSILVCIILGVKALLGRRLPARWHTALWLLLLVRMVMPWAPASSVSVFNLMPVSSEQGITDYVGAEPVDEVMDAQPVQEYKVMPAAEAVTSAEMVSAEESRSWRELGSSGIKILPFMWLVGVLVFLVYVFATSLCIWIEIRCERPLTNQKVLDLLEACKAQIGIRTPLTVVETSRAASPALFGFIRPRLLLPAGITETLGLEELRYVFLHELAHVKRYDIVINWLMSYLQVLHWFNPFVWYAFYRMRVDRELACDALALSRGRPGESAEYGRTIVNLLERFSRPRYLPAMAGILESKSQLKRRITMIARFKKGSYRWSIPAIVLLAVLSCVVLTNAQGTSQTKSQEPKILAKEFVELLVKGRFSTATKNFDSTMKNALPAGKLKEVWKSTTGQAGAFKQQIGIRTEKFMGSDIVFVTCEFEEGPLDVKVVYNNERQISGLWFVPVPLGVLKGYRDKPDEKTDIFETSTIVKTKKKISQEELEKIVEDAVLTISTRAENDPRVAATLETLQGLDEQAVVKEVVKFLDSDKNTVKRSAMYILWRGDFKNIEPAEIALQKLCSHDEEHTRGMAALALGARKVNSSFETLCDMALEDSSSYARRCAAYALGLMGKAEGKPILEKALKDSDFNVRNNAEAALTMLSQASKSKSTKPMVVNTNPVAFSKDVSPKLKKITVTFDKPMMNLSWSWVGGGDTYPEMTGKPRYNPKRTTCSLPVKLEPGKVYWVGINSPKYKNFQTAEGMPAVPYVILFATKDVNGRPTPVPQDLLAKAKAINARSQNAVEVGVEGQGKVNEADKLASEDLAAEGWQLWRQRKLAEAEKEFKKAVEKDPTNANGWNGLGWSQLNQGKRLNAKHSFKKCLEIEPKHPAALNGLGWIAKGQGKTDEAIGHWEKAITASPYTTASLSGLTQTYMELKQYDKAAKYYQMWLSVEPENVDAKAGLEKAEAALKSK